MDNIFATVETPSGFTARILDGKGAHFFRAMQACKGDTSVIAKYLICELVIINSTPVTPAMVDEMSIQDISYLSEVISLQLIKPQSQF